MGSKYKIAPFKPKQKRGWPAWSEDDPDFYNRHRTGTRPRYEDDLEDWCKARVGWYHDSTYRKPVSLEHLPCGWRRGFYQCHHREVCSTCGKILHQSLAASLCPSYTDNPLVEWALDLKAAQ